MLQLQPNKDDMENSRCAQPWSKDIREQKHVEFNEHKNRNEISGVNTSTLIQKILEIIVDEL